jgi:hypothetical protein
MRPAGKAPRIGQKPTGPVYTFARVRMIAPSCQCGYV